MNANQYKLEALLHSHAAHPFFEYASTCHPTLAFPESKSIPPPPGQGWIINPEASGDDALDPGVSYREEGKYLAWRRPTKSEPYAECDLAAIHCAGIGYQLLDEYEYARLVGDVRNLHTTDTITLQGLFYRLLPELALADKAGRPWRVNNHHPSGPYCLTAKRMTLEVYRPKEPNHASVS